MKRIISYLLAFVLLTGMILVPSGTVRAAECSFTASTTTAKVGENVRFTLTVPDGYYASYTVVVSDDSVLGGSYNNPISTGNAAGQSTSTSFTLQAKQVGTATVSLVFKDASDSNENDVTFSDLSVTVNVVNESQEENKSSDNYLKSLVTSSGTLSPAFSKKVYDYQMEVSNATTNLSIQATVNDTTAKVVRVTGNKNLKVGMNTVAVVVRAENGVERTYTIHVKRLDESETTPETTQSPQSDQTQTFTLGNQKLALSDEIPTENLPADFAESTITISGKTYKGFEFSKYPDFVIVYLIDQETQTGAFYAYDHNQNVVYPFVKISSEKGYLIVMMPDEKQIPDTYMETNLSIEGKGSVRAYQTKNMQQKPESDTQGDVLGFLDWFAPEIVYAQDSAAFDFYYLYGINQDGKIGWYQYDKVEGTYQRLVNENGQIDPTDSEQLQNDYNALERRFSAYKTKAMLVAAIALIGILVLIIILIGVIASSTKKHENEFDFMLDSLDDSEDLPESSSEDEPFKAESSLATQLSMEGKASVEEAPTIPKTDIVDEIEDDVVTVKPIKSQKKEKFDTVDLTEVSKQLEDDDFTIIDL